MTRRWRNGTLIWPAIRVWMLAVLAAGVAGCGQATPVVLEDAEVSVVREVTEEDHLRAEEEYERLREELRERQQLLIAAWEERQERKRALDAERDRLQETVADLDRRRRYDKISFREYQDQVYAAKSRIAEITDELGPFWSRDSDQRPSLEPEPPEDLSLALVGAHRKLEFQVTISNRTEADVPVAVVCRRRSSDDLIVDEKTIGNVRVRAGWREEASLQKTVLSSEYESWEHCFDPASLELKWDRRADEGGR